MPASSAPPPVACGNTIQSKKAKGDSTEHTRQMMADKL
jgi:hypothetical protein